MIWSILRAGLSDTATQFTRTNTAVLIYGPNIGQASIDIENLFKLPIIVLLVLCSCTLTVGKVVQLLCPVGSSSSSSSSSMFISRPTPLRAYAVLILSGTPPPMTKLNSLNVHSLHPSKLHVTRFPSEE